MTGDGEKEVFPRRGTEMTRLETFTDAAFAFAAALLAISIDEVPSTYTELLEALKGAPAFGASLALLLLYWRAHQVWSNRFGLEGLPAVLLTFALIMVVMVYVYPLKIMFGAAFYFATSGWLPSSFVLNSSHQFRGLLTVYGIGFLLLNVLVSSLYLYAWLQRKQLDMSPAESSDCILEVIAWAFVGCFGLVSIMMAWTLANDWLSMAAGVYALLFLAGPGIGLLQSRLAARVSRQ